MIDLTTPTATVRSDWYTTGYTPICSPSAFDSYMRDVEMSPDGSFFVVATTGGPHGGTLCDTASRFETYAVGTALTPTWVTNSGGDTLWGVEITRSAVYVGGHNRWMNNPNGADSAGQGSVPRPGLSALDPQTGVPLKWNPGRNPRGEAAYEIYETDAGVWVVSDTDWIGDRRYQRPRIAFFPYSEGYNTASKNTGSLPGNVYIGAPLAASNVLYRVNAAGAAIASLDNGPDWVADNAATSPFHNTGSSVATRSALTAANLTNVPASTPLGIWTSERYDPSGGTDMQWTFPVASGTSTQVRLYFSSRSSSTRRFNVLVDGVTKLSNYDPNADPGVNRGTMKAFDITSDGTVNIDFTRVTGDPEINAIEIVNNSIGSNATAASVVNFTGTTISSQSTVSTGTFDWTNVRNAVMVGRSLFYGQTDGMLYKRSFDGVSFGAPTAVNPYIDPLWNTVLTGSGPATQTYTGVLPSWYGQLTNVTGMFYANGRIYYTRSGQASLYWRWFSPDSGIIGGVENTVAGGNITWSATRGMFLSGTRPVRRELDQRSAAQDRLRQRGPDRHLDGGEHDHRLARPGRLPRLGAAQRGPDGRLHMELHRHHVHVRRDRLRGQRREHLVLRVDLQRRGRGRRRQPGEGLRRDRDLRRDPDGHRRRRAHALDDPPDRGREAQRRADGGLHGVVRVPRVRPRRQLVDRQRRHHRRLRVGLR